MRINPKSVFTIIIGAMVAQLGYPPAGFWLLAVAVVPVGWALALGQHPKAAFRLGFDYGLGFFLGLLYWLIHTLCTYGGLPTVASAALLCILCLYLALYPALTLACVAIAMVVGLAAMNNHYRQQSLSYIKTLEAEIAEVERVGEEKFNAEMVAAPPSAELKPAQSVRQSRGEAARAH